MITDRDRTYQAAQKYLQKGQLDKAIAEYEALVQGDPSDLRALLKVGDLQLRLGNGPAAARAYVQVAQSYARDGFFLKAVAVYKQVCNIDPEDAVAARALAGLYEQLGLAGDALAQWRHLSALHARAGRWQASLDAIERVRASGEQADEVVLHWAELVAKLGDVPAAVRELQSLAESHHGAGRLEAWSKVAERLLALDPPRAGLACNLARHYMDRGDAHAALLKLRLAFQAAPQDDEILGLLARAFEALGQRNKATQVLRELEAQAAQRGQPHVRLRVLQQIARLNPDDADAEAALMRLQEEIEARRTGRSGAQAAPPPGGGAPANVAAGDFAKLVVEATIFRRYGLYRRALELLEQVLGAAPEHAEARALLGAYAAEMEALSRRGRPGATGDGRATPKTTRIELDALQAPAQHAAAAYFADEPSVVDAPRPRVAPTTVTSGPWADPGAAAGSVADAAGDALAFDGDALDVDRLIAAAMPAGGAPQLSTADALGAAGFVPAAAEAASADLETHFNLGVAYREMGLYDEAIAQLTLAQTSERRAFDARHLAALCELSAQRPQQAATLLQQALAVPRLTAPQQLAGHYAMGLSLRLLGEDGRAQEHLRSVAVSSPDYRHAAALLSAGQRADLLQEAVGALLQAPPQPSAG